MIGPVSVRGSTFAIWKLVGKKLLVKNVLDLGPIRFLYSCRHLNITRRGQSASIHQQLRKIVVHIVVSIGCHELIT